MGVYEFIAEDGSLMLCVNGEKNWKKINGLEEKYKPKTVAEWWDILAKLNLAEKEEKHEA